MGDSKIKRPLVFEMYLKLHHVESQAPYQALMMYVVLFEIMESCTTETSSSPHSVIHRQGVGITAPDDTSLHSFRS
jgi:hypothetical protein